MGLGNFFKRLFGNNTVSATVEGGKLCTKCNRYLPRLAFHRNNRTNDRLQYWCIDCRRSYDKNANLKNKIAAPVKVKKPATARASCLSVEAAAKRVGLSANYFYKLLRRGHGPQFLRVGKRYIISEQALADWVNSSKKGGE